MEGREVACCRLDIDCKIEKEEKHRLDSLIHRKLPRAAILLVEERDSDILLLRGIQDR